MSENFAIIFSSQARQSLRKLPLNIQKKMREKISLLSFNPRPSGIKAIKGKKGLFRLRVGDYRVIYKIENQLLIITIIEVGHRKEIYRDY